ARHVARPQALPRFRLLATEATGRAGVDNLRRAALADAGHVGHVAHHRGVETGGEVTLLDRARLAILDRAALGAPFGQAAVEHRHVVVPHHAEHPPGAGGGEQAELVV